MSIASMTGFARTEGFDEACSWAWEVRSVNAKGRDIRCRVPGGFESVDPKARERVQKKFRRGNISMTLSTVWNEASCGFQVNRDVLDQYLSLLPEIQGRLADTPAPRIEGLLALRGVIEPVEAEKSGEGRQALEAAVLEGLDRALDSLAEMRAGEGLKLTHVLMGQLSELKGLYDQASALAALRPEAIRERLKKQVSELLTDLPALPEERLAQEAAVLMVKGDLREELDRLSAHMEAAGNLLKQGGAVGRKLDFLCQEFNREANTLCSKSADVALTRIGIDIKTVVDQFREQVQNIE